MLSQTTEYALRAMACLAHAPDRLTATPELARHTSVPPNYLAKVLQQLSAADLITGRRGVGGGYRLARRAEEIRLVDVINAVTPVRRFDLTPEQPTEGNALDLGPLYEQLDHAARSLISHFEATTLQDLIPPREAGFARARAESPANGSSANGAAANGLNELSANTAN